METLVFTVCFIDFDFVSSEYFLTVVVQSIIGAMHHHCLLHTCFPATILNYWSVLFALEIVKQRQDFIN